MRALDADRVHDRSHVVHARFETGHADGAVTETRPPLVEGGNAGEPRHAANGCAESRVEVGKRLVDTRDEPGNEDDIERTVTDGCICDVDVSTSCVLDPGHHKRFSHGRIVHVTRAL